MYNSVFKIICSIQVANTVRGKALLLSGFTVQARVPKAGLKTVVCS